ncbi:Holliday junction DNA helicase RuvA [Rubellimicrobium mesophilum DSM 19309]|uniref:Holliday junction branch migration complex subunit RuvA n=1 Tax=Rubellimicrobium mesophilum DSM 19309 TaxID=442562 RepID=A0A017HUJ4_9RHOB|nr:Holliday junction branch migration protein RuvA [Rubellimicrobium mesophilum]EYD77995.1 Holliday junction DNA helicase RuvA [Rubellimicrobium mesophilum DSM 19309]
MIGRVAGRLLYRAGDHVLIDVRGVGYLVHVSERVLAGLPRNGEAVALFTELQVREDGWTLFGFPTLVEKEWHRLLLTVQGVGAKVSLALLGALGPDALGRSIALGDWATLARAKGVGPKTAQRIVNELRDKAPAVMAMAGLIGTTAVTTHELEPDEVQVVEVEAAPAPKAAPRRKAENGQGMAQAEALSALGNLGYAPGEAVQAVAQAAESHPQAGTPELIRAALRLLAPKE